KREREQPSLLTIHLSLFRRLLVVGNFGAFLQLPADRAVTSRNYFVARLNTALNLHVSVVRDSGRHFDQLRLATFFQKHDFRLFLALLFVGHFYLTLVPILGSVDDFLVLDRYYFFFLCF